MQVISWMCRSRRTKGDGFFLADNFEHHHVVRVNAACLVSVVSRSRDDT